MATLISEKETKGKDSRFFARISSSDKRLIEEAASITGQSTATFVIAQAREAATRLVESYNVIRLNEADSRNLMEALLNPPPPNENLVRALKLYRETVISDVNPESPAVW